MNKKNTTLFPKICRTKRLVKPPAFSPIKLSAYNYSFGMQMVFRNDSALIYPFRDVAKANRTTGKNSGFKLLPVILYSSYADPSSAPIVFFKTRH